MTQKKSTIEMLDFEIEFYEKLLEKKPDEITILVPLGNAYTKRGLYEKGLFIDKKLIKLKPDEPVFYYNLACTFSLREQKREAIESLRRAFELGYRDFKHIEIDPDLNNIRNNPQFNSLLREYNNTPQG